jgi:asparagine synthase (glutamine-hydrolysing)
MIVMSGFVFGFGQVHRHESDVMFEKVAHRGPYISGVFQTPEIVMAQNYLEADGAQDTGSIVPIRSSSNPDLRICYDGQIGNCNELMRTCGISAGPFQEERLLLHLYEKHGIGMLERLDDAIFAFIISDGEDFFAARDVLGIKTLFYGFKNGTVYLASELKSILEATKEVREFPPGYHMDRKRVLGRFAGLPQTPPETLDVGPEQMAEEILDMVRRSLRNRIDFNLPTGSLLSGGIDSSVIALLASEAYREKFGNDAKLKTFALGIGQSEDIENARVMAEHMNSDHHELIVDLEQMLAALPSVIYHLESFDPSLVRSAVSNYFISQYAGEHGIQVLLSGEGGDEVFCGYTYMKDFPLEEQFSCQVQCLGFLHNNAALRLDRMNACHGLRVVAPLISGELLRYALAIAPKYKQMPTEQGKIEKWIFRKAFEAMLPEKVAWRTKQEFSQGSGSAGVLAAYFEEAITDDALEEAQAKLSMVRSKEELYYLRIFIEYFGSDQAVKTVGQWICA